MSMSVPDKYAFRVNAELLVPGQKVVLDEKTLGNFVYERGKKPLMLTREKIGPYRSGTGDVFASIITGCAARGQDFRSSVQLASDFISKALRRTMELDIPKTDGVCFEEFLFDLTPEASL